MLAAEKNQKVTVNAGQENRASITTVDEELSLFQVPQPTTPISPPELTSSSSLHPMTIHTTPHHITAHGFVADHRGLSGSTGGAARRDRPTCQADLSPLEGEGMEKNKPRVVMRQSGHEHV
jgi:hypothetical protein